MSDTTFIYGLFDPRNYQLRYIGKSDNPDLRLKQHIKEANDKKKFSRYVANWIRQLLSEGLEPSIEILEEVSTEIWQEAERAWIADCRKFGLKITNTTDGGDGLINPTPEVRAKLGWMKGKTHTKEWSEKMSALFKGRVSPMKGKKHSPEAIKKIIENRGVILISDEECKARSDRNQWRGKDGFMKGKKFTEEHKRKISESHLGEKNPMFGKMQSEETIRKRIEKTKGQKRSEEFKKASSERQKGKELTEKHKENLRLGWIKRKEKYGKTKFKRVGD